MERFLSFIEYLRSLPEEVRRHVMWGIVAVVVLAVGAAWAVSLRWQIRGPDFGRAAAQEARQEQEAQENLPSITESLRGSTSEVKKQLKEMLRGVVLGDESNERESQDGTEAASQEEESLEQGTVYQLPRKDKNNTAPDQQAQPEAEDTVNDPAGDAP